MARAIFKTKPVVCVNVVFNARKNVPELFHDFLSFLNKQNILYRTPWATANSGRTNIEYLGFHTAEEATKIEAWIIKHGGVKRKN